MNLELEKTKNSHMATCGGGHQKRGVGQVEEEIGKKVEGGNLITLAVKKSFKKLKRLFIPEN